MRFAASNFHPNLTIQRYAEANMRGTPLEIAFPILLTSNYRLGRKWLIVTKTKAYKTQ